MCSLFHQILLIRIARLLAKFSDHFQFFGGLGHLAQFRLHFPAGPGVALAGQGNDAAWIGSWAGAGGSLNV